MDGKHGNHGFHIKGLHMSDGDWVEFDSPVFVMIHDNSDAGLTNDELRKIAESSVDKTIFWNDVGCYYWMFDFKVWDHWCEMLHEDHTGESIYECMHINVYS